MNLETIHPADNMFEQLEQSRQVRKHMLLHSAKQEEHVTLSETDVEAIEIEPFTEAIGDSPQSGHAVVTSQPNGISSTEVLDECQHKYSPIIMPIEECADQSEPTLASRQVAVAELEQGRDTELEHLDNRRFLLLPFLFQKYMFLRPLRSVTLFLHGS